MKDDLVLKNNELKHSNFYGKGIKGCNKFVLF